MICPSPKLHIGRYRDIYTRSKMGSRCYCCYVAFHFLLVHYLFLLSAVSYTYTALPCWSFQTCGFYILRAVLILFLKCFSLYIQKNIYVYYICKTIYYTTTVYIVFFIWFLNVRAAKSRPVVLLLLANITLHKPLSDVILVGHMWPRTSETASSCRKSIERVYRPRFSVTRDNTRTTTVYTTTTTTRKRPLFFRRRTRSTTTTSTRRRHVHRPYYISSILLL